MSERCAECGGPVLWVPHSDIWHQLQRRLLVLAAHEMLQLEVSMRAAAQYEALYGRVLVLWRLSPLPEGSLYCTSHVPGELVDGPRELRDDLLAALGEGVKEHYASRYGVRPDMAQVTYRVFDERGLPCDRSPGR